MPVKGSGRVDNQKYYLHTWADMPNGETGEPMAAGKLADKTVQVTGTFGTGGTVTMEGSMNGTDWISLADEQGNVLTFTGGNGGLIMQNYRYIRPNITAGDATTAITVYVGASALEG